MQGHKAVDAIVGLQRFPCFPMWLHLMACTSVGYLIMYQVLWLNAAQPGKRRVLLDGTPIIGIQSQLGCAAHRFVTRITGRTCDNRGLPLRHSKVTSGSGLKLTEKLAVKCTDDSMQSATNWFCPWHRCLMAPTPDG